MVSQADKEISNDDDNDGSGRLVGRVQGGGSANEHDARRGNVRRSKEAVARDPRDRQSQLAQVAGPCPLTHPTISNYVSPRERIYCRQRRLDQEVPLVVVPRTRNMHPSSCKSIPPKSTLHYTMPRPSPITTPNSPARHARGISPRLRITHSTGRYFCDPPVEIFRHVSRAKRLKRLARASQRRIPGACDMRSCSSLRKTNDPLVRETVSVSAGRPRHRRRRRGAASLSCPEMSARLRPGGLARLIPCHYDINVMPLKRCVCSVRRRERRVEARIEPT